MRNARWISWSAVVFASLIGCSPHQTLPRARAGEAMPPGALRRALVSHDEQITSCLEEARLTDPAAAGHMVLQFGVYADGAVADARVLYSDLTTPRVGDCLAEAARSWRLPPTTNNREMTVQVAITLRPGRFGWMGPYDWNPPEAEGEP